MIRMHSVAQKLTAFALVAGAALSTATSAYALPHPGLHHRPADVNDNRVVLDIYNKGDMFRDVKVDGKIYTLLPHHSMTIKAPQGTPVFTNSTGSLHRKGDLLFYIDPSMKNKVLSID